MAVVDHAPTAARLRISADNVVPVLLFAGLALLPFAGGETFHSRSADPYHGVRRRGDRA